MEEVLFKDANGEEVYLPENTGKQLGFKRVKTFTPPEVDGGEVSQDAPADSTDANVDDAGAEAADPAPADSTTEPKETEQPGKAGAAKPKPGK